MVAVDFTAWVAPDLDLTLGGRAYRVRPPSVAQGRKIAACAVRAEVNLGLVNAPIPADVAALLDALEDEPLGDITLGADVHAAMVADGLPAIDIDRAAYYALHFWARGREQADWIASHLWGEDAQARAKAAAAPKAPRPRRSRSGRPTGSANQTPTASTPTTGSRPS